MLVDTVQNVMFSNYGYVVIAQSFNLVVKSFGRFNLAVHDHFAKVVAICQPFLP